MIISYLHTFHFLFSLFYIFIFFFFFFFSSRRRHTRYWRDWSSDVCSSDLWHFSRDSASVTHYKDERTAPNVFILPYSFIVATGECRPEKGPVGPKIIHG